jgi:hypothetical protein
MVNLSIVLASPVVIKINILVNVLNAVTSHFQYRKDKCFIISCLHPITIPIFHMFLLNLQENAHRECSHMSKFLSDKSVKLIFYLSKTVWSGIAFIEVILMKLSVKMIGISKTWLFCLIDHVEDLED